MRRGRGATAAVIVTSLVTISAGAWGLSEWRPFHDDAEVDWPDNVQPIVDYVEDVTDLEFKHAIEFEFIGNRSEYNDRAGDPAYEYDDEARAAIAIDEGVGRALGLWSGDVSLMDSFDAINASAPRPARWIAAENLMLVNSRESDRVFPVNVRVDLVVYLTQALTDQHFDVVRRLEATTSSQEYDGLAAAYLGFALWVYDEYVDDLNAADRSRYETESMVSSGEYAESVESVPATYLAARIAFQVLGQVFATALAEDDPALALDALSSRVPVALDQVSLPRGKYLREDSLENVDAPPGPAEATIHYSEQLGPMRLFLMFATGLPVTEALTAADGWGNDRYTVYELDGRVCVDTHIVADSRADADRLERAVAGWAFARPDESDALVGRDGVHLYASVCDPGAEVVQTIPGITDSDHYFGRANLLRQLAVTTGKPDLAECIATEVFARFTSERIFSGEPDSEVDAAFQDIEDDCRNNLLTV